MGSGRVPEPTVLEATSGFEPLIGVLQTPALPLGHVAAMRKPGPIHPWLSGNRLERKTRFELATLTLAR
jgi:hypothetical protein